MTNNRFNDMYNNFGDGLMVIYLDLVIASTVCVNLALFKTIAIVMKEKLKWYRILIALVVSVLSLALYIVPFRFIWSFRYFVGVIIGFIAFRGKNYQDRIIKIVIYYMLNMVFIGSLVVFNIKNSWLMIIALLYTIILWIIENYKNIILKQQKLTYNVKIGDLSTTGYLDTGNNSYFEGIPIVYINKNLYQQFIKLGMTIIKQIDINGIGKMKVDIYDGPLLEVENNYYVVYYAFLEGLNYNILLNYEMAN